MIRTVRFEGGARGPGLLLLGGVHGDEAPGYRALERLTAELERGRLRLLQGSLVIAARVNAEACARGLHQVDENLNRIVRPHDAPATREQKLANELIPLIESADVVLDLHGAPAPTRPFVFLDDEAPENRAWAEALGVDFLLTGWSALYGGATVTTTEYAQALGKRALTVEVGQNDDAAAADRGYVFALRTLSHFGLISPWAPAPKPRALRLTRVVYREREGAFARDWANFDAVKKGEVLIRYADGAGWAAPEDASVVMPFSGALPGEEWLYLAVAEGPSSALK